MKYEKVGYMEYKDGTLFICNGKNKMFFPCDNEFAGKIMDSVKKSYTEFYDNLRAQQEHVKESRKFGMNGTSASKAHVMFEGYEKIGVVDDITVYVKCISHEAKFFRFEYYSDKMYTRHGCTQVDITMDI